MKTEVVMPQMGESIAEGTIARWLKKIGDAVDRDEPLFELTTDKVDAEIPAPAAGILVAIHVAQGATAPVNSVVAIIEDAAGPGASIGPAEAGPGGRVRISPVARRIARDHRLDFATIAGSGGAGRIIRQDVLRLLDGGTVGGTIGGTITASPAAATPAPAPAASPAGAETVPMTVMRRKIAEHMIASRRTSAHVHSVFQVDCSRVEALRQARKKAYEAAGVKLSILPFIVKATCAALRAWPVLNASLDGDTIRYHGEVNLGIAVALDSGLIVPVIRHADRLPLIEIGRAIGDLARRARAKQLKPEEVSGGTFAVTNPGNFGGTFATPIINQPQVAILELGTVEKRVVVVDDALAIRPMMHLTLGFDHRLIDGAVADQFLASVKRGLENWEDDQL